MSQLQPVAGIGVVALALSGVAGAVLVPTVTAAWRALGAVDRELSLRKVHVGDIPRAGGLAVMLAFGSVVLVGLAGVSPLSAVHEMFSISPLTGVLIGALIVWATGIADDLIGVRARTKLGLQFVAAVVAVGFGLEWPAMVRLLGPNWAWCEPVVTIVFVLALVNAYNFMDGLDGLAGTLVAIPLTVIVLVQLGSVSPAGVAVSWVSAAALGATLAFLAFNRSPASVFLGDGGAYLLGFLLAAMSIGLEPVRDRVAIIDVSTPVFLAAVPLFDLLLAVGRRTIRGQPVSAADSDHIHHRLLAAGFSAPGAVAVIGAAAVMFACLAVANLAGVGGWWTLLGALVSICVSAVLLGYHRLLARLPAFQSAGRWSWRERRRQVIAVLAQLEHVSLTAGTDPEIWWLAVGPSVGDALVRIGIPRFEVRDAGQQVYAHGDGASAWGYLGMPLPGHPCREVRLFLEVQLAALQPEAVMVLEKALGVLSQQAPGSRSPAAASVLEAAA